jgi:sulfonate transport system permease protein
MTTTKNGLFLATGSRLWRCLAVLAFFLFWQIASLAISNPKALPGIDYVLLHSLPSIAIFSGGDHEDLWTALSVIGVNSAYTLFRIAIGLLFGITIGLLVGTGIHIFHYTRKANEGLLTVIRAVPLLALIPLFLFWFGGREVGIYVYIIFAVSVIVATNTYEAIGNLPPNYTYLARLMGANRRLLFASVYMPAIQPEMAGSFRNVLGLAWAFSLGAEYLSATSGLGHLVYQSYLYCDMGKLIVFVWIYGIYGMAGFYLSQRLLNKLRHWNSESASGG